MTHAESGATLGASRRTRTCHLRSAARWNTALAGCRFSGGDNRIGDNAHLIRHWADGGATTLSNLVLPCRRCHRRVHEDGYGSLLIRPATIP